VDASKRVTTPVAHPNPEVSHILELERDAHPYWADVQNNWGLLCLSRGDVRSGREAFEEALSINPKYRWAALNLAAALALEGWGQEAWSRLRTVKDPDFPARDLTEAWIALVTGDLDRARAVRGRLQAREGVEIASRIDFWWLTARIDGSPTAPPPPSVVNCTEEIEGLVGAPEVIGFPGLQQLWKAVSRIQMRLGNTAGAQSSARLAFAFFSDVAQYLNHQGHLASLQGEDEEARKYYEQALPIDAADPTAPAALARHWSVQDDLGKAVGYLEEALRRAPRFADLLRLMGQLECARGNYERALSFSRRALEINPRYRSARVEEANTLFLMSRWHDAAMTYRTLVREGFRSSDILLHLGRCEEECGRFRDAERAYLEAIDLNAEELLAHYRLSLLYRRLGREEPADRAWRTALELNRRPEVRTPVETLIESPGFRDEEWPLPGENRAA